MRTPIQPLIKAVLDGDRLAEVDAASLMDGVMRGDATDIEIAALLGALRARGETIDEIVGFARAMRRAATTVPLPDSLAGRAIVDTCGTGGDGAGTFNISTAAAFVVAGAGVAVAKHGNRAATSCCGSADVLEALGVRLDLSADRVGHCVAEVGIGFLFAPALHTAMRHVAPVRKALPARTVFNLLGPLTNPAGVTHQILGVFDERLCEPLAHVLGGLGVERALVVRGTDGLDEISTTAPTRVARLEHGAVNVETIDYARELGLTHARLDDLRGGDATDNARRIEAILGGRRGPDRDIVAANAAACLELVGAAPDLRTANELATRTIDTGAASNTLARLIAFTREHVAVEVTS